MEPESSLPHSQEPATCPYPDPDYSSQCPRPTSWRGILILSYHLRLCLPIGPFPYGFPNKTLQAPTLCLIGSKRRAHFIILDLLIQKIYVEAHRAKSSSLYSLLQCPVVSSLLGTNIFLSTLLSNTLSLWSFLNVRDKVSFPYKTKVKIVSMYILIFTCLDSKVLQVRHEIYKKCVTSKIDHSFSRCLSIWEDLCPKNQASDLFLLRKNILQIKYMKASQVVGMNNQTELYQPQIWKECGMLRRTEF